MLTKIILKNFKSFKEETELNFRATGYEILSETNKNKDNILKGALFVGGNATGKSNFLSSLKFLLYLLVGEKIINQEEFICLFSNKNMEATYEFEFDKKIISYKIVCSMNKEIQEEKLFLDNSLILERLGKTAKYMFAEDVILLQELSNNASAVRKVYFENQFNNNKILNKWFEFLSNSIYIDQSRHVIIGSNHNYNNYFEKEGEKNFNDFLNTIGYEQEVKYVHEYKGKVSFEFNDNMGRPYKEIIFKRKNMDFALPFGLESEGNKTLIYMFVAVLTVLKKPGMILIDEFSSSFHNRLEEAVIKFFMKNSKESQMFFVSHSTNLLNNCILRPDQIFTVTFKDDKGSIVYRVSDAQPREAQNLEKMYLNGVFDGVPTYK